MRALTYVLAWLGCWVVVAACAVELAVLALFYAVMGPIACVYVGARLGAAAGLGFFSTTVMMLAGLALYASVRVPLYQHMLRWGHHSRRVMLAAGALRDDLWRRYHRGQTARN